MKALKYLLSCSPINASMQMAVIVQRLVPGEVSGVAFSRSPTDPHDRSIIIEAVAGLGDSLVSGKEVSSHFRVDESDHCEVDLADAAVRDMPGSLDESRLVRLANICRQLRREWGQEVDVEFAFVESDNEPYVLQCRPITVTLDANRHIVRPRRLTDRVLQGITCADGFAEGEAIDFRQFHGDVSQLEDKILLVDGLTTDEYDAVFACRGVISQRHDSQLNHVSIACREMGIPYIAAVDNVCHELAGRRLALDGGTGSVWVLPDEPAYGSQRPQTSDRASPSAAGNEFAYLPFLEDMVSATEVTFRGLDLFLLSLAHQTTTRAELEMAFLERLDSALAASPSCMVRLLPPTLSATELAAFNESVARLNLTSVGLRDWIAQLLTRLQHRHRVRLV